MVTSTVVAAWHRPVSIRWACSSTLSLAIVGACIRWAFNDVRRYGNGDEYHYRLQTADIFTKGWTHFPELVRWHLSAEPDFPAPYRWGTLLFGKLACSVRQICDERSLAWVSTVSGMAVLALVALLALKLFGRQTALLATAFAVSSPLHLELGRRAYADELHTALLLLSLLGLAHVASSARTSREVFQQRIWAAITLTSLTFAWSVKESVAFMLPALGFWVFSLRSPRSFKFRDAFVLLAPPTMALLGFAFLNHGFSGLKALIAATQSSLRHPYSTAFQAGPPHRPLVELFTLSPVVFGMLPVVAFVAFGLLRTADNAADGNPARDRAKSLSITLLLLLGAFALLPKNLRFCAVCDPLARLLVAWFLSDILPWSKSGNLLWCTSIVLGNAAYELALFHRTFVISSVTDPTASAIFGALQMIPSETRVWKPPWFVHFSSISSAILAWAAAKQLGFARKSVLAAGLMSVVVLVTPRMLRPQRALADVPHQRGATERIRDSLHAPEAP